MYIHTTFIDASHLSAAANMGIFFFKCFAFSTSVFSHCFSDVYVVRKTWFFFNLKENIS